MRPLLFPPFNRPTHFIESLSLTVCPYDIDSVSLCVIIAQLRVTQLIITRSAFPFESPCCPPIYTSPVTLHPSSASLLESFSLLMPHTSDAHRHFKEVRDQHGIASRECIHCPPTSVKRYNRKTSTDVLNKHIAQFHSAHSRQSRPSSQRTMDEMAVVTDNGAFKAALAHFFARCSLAHRIAELDEFKELIDRARLSTCEVPKRKALRQSQLSLAQSLRRRVVHQLRTFCRSSPLTIAIDGWTNVSTAKVTNVVALCGGEAYYWCSIVNASNHNTAAWLSQPLVEAMNDLRGEGLVFAAMVADNEQVNKVLHTIVSTTFPFLVRAPCAAHLVQLCVLKSLELPSIEPVFETMVTLLRQFRAKALRLKLKAMQEAGPTGPGSALNLLRPCDTRWSSQLYAAQRLLRLRSFVDIVLPQEAQFWADIISIIRFLRPFQIATDVLQSDRATIYDAYLQYKDLLVHVNQTNPTSLFGGAVASLRDILHDMWDKHVIEEAVIACALVAFDTHVNSCFAPERIRAAVEWLLLFAARYALYWSLAGSSVLEELRQQAKAEWSDFIGRTATSSFSSLDQDVIDIQAVHAKEQRRFDARSVWHLHSSQAPVIANAAVALLSISSSEAAVERTFSAQGDVHSNRRNRLGDETVEAEMFIKFNERTVSRAEENARVASNNRKKPLKRRLQAEREQGCVEMADESDGDDSDDDVPSVQGIFTRPVIAVVADEQGGLGSLAVPDIAVDDVAPVVRTVPPAPVTDPVQAFIVQYVRDNLIHSHFRWKGYQLQQLEAAGAAWKPPMRDTPDQLRKRVMAWVRSEEYRELAVHEAADEGSAHEEKDEKEIVV